MATYTTPTARVDGTTQAAADFNTYYTESIKAIYNGRGDTVRLNVGADLTTTSATFVDITGLTITFTLDATAHVALLFTGVVDADGAGAPREAFFDFTVDGVRQGLDDGIGLVTGGGGGTDEETLTMHCLAKDLAAGSHTFTVQWKSLDDSGGGTATLYAGAGTSRRDVHPYFSAYKI